MAFTWQSQMVTVNPCYINPLNWSASEDVGIKFLRVGQLIHVLIRDHDVSQSIVQAETFCNHLEITADP